MEDNAKAMEEACSSHPDQLPLVGQPLPSQVPEHLQLFMKQGHVDMCPELTSCA